MPIELEVIQAAKADDLLADDPTGRPKIDRNGSGVCGGPGDRTSERRQKQKSFFHSVFFGNGDPTNQTLKAAVEVPKLFFVTIIARARA